MLRDVHRVMAEGRTVGPATLSVRIDADLHQRMVRLQALALASGVLGVSASVLVRDALDRYLDVFEDELMLARREG